MGPSGDRLFVLSNQDGADNFAPWVTGTRSPNAEPDWRSPAGLVAAGDRAPRRRPARGRRRVRRPHRGVERADAREQLRILDLDAEGTVADDHVVAPHDEVGSMWMGSNPEYEAPVMRYGYTSLVSPLSAYDYDTATRTSTS